MTVSNEAFEAAKKVHDEALPYLQMHHRLRESLEAAAPFIQAQALEEVANEFEADRFTDPWDIPDILRARAAALRGQG